VPAVRDEIEQGRQFGHEYLDSAVKAFGDELRVSDVSPETEDEQFRERLDAGEADALRGALSAWTHHYNLAFYFAESRRRAELCAYLLLVRHSLQRRRERI
jgi:predicted nucleic acid-binding protein